MSTAKISISMVQFFYNRLLLAMAILFWVSNFNKKIGVVFIIIFVYMLIITVFLDTINVIAVDPNDNYISYYLRFFPFFLLILFIIIKKITIIKLVVLIGTISVTKNNTIKDEYKRFLSLIFYLYFVNNLFISDFNAVLVLLYWYYFLEKFQGKLVEKISNNKQICVNLVYVYARYYLIKKTVLLWFFFITVFFSIPFLLYLLFNARFLGIVIMNVILTILLLARFCYVKIIADPEFAFELLKDLPLKYCDRYFTAIASLLQFEMVELQKILTSNNGWVVYSFYEEYRDKIRQLIEDDIYNIEKNPGWFFQPVELQEVLTRYYELAELPFNNFIFIKNEIKLQEYRLFQSLKLKLNVDSDDLKNGLTLNNSLEVRVKNPLYFIGFFSLDKFFLHR